MSSLFDDLQEGLCEAIAFEKGKGTAKTRTYIIEPVREYSDKEIRDIRIEAGMTQAIFAEYMGVSKKTVEAWECGRTHPTGPAFRLLDILTKQTTDYVTFIRQQ